MGGKKSKRPRPSFEEGALRDQSIAARQDPNFQPKNLIALIKRAIVQRPSKPTKSAK